jgi:predicted phosphodiesterase
MKKTTLIISDLHHRWQQAEEIIATVDADEIIFLGDYFDDFNDDPAAVRETCEWFESSVSKPNRIHLFGNHDQHYAYVYRTFRCSGYAQWKYFIIHDTLPHQIWNKVKWYHFLDGRWLLTHGGLHKDNVPGSILKLKTDRPKFIKELGNYLDYHIREGFRLGATGQNSWIFNAGAARWGNQKIGGITWCDFEKEFAPFRGINQIVGHTPQGMGFPKWCRIAEDGHTFRHPYDMFVPTLKQLDNPEMSINIDLDVWGNMHYGIWNGGKLVVRNYKDL